MEKELEFREWSWLNKTKDITDSIHKEVGEIMSAENLYELSLEVINTTIESGQPFSSKDISDKIREKWGIQRVSQWVTVRMYIEKLEDNWLIQFDPTLEKYRTTELFEKTFTEAA